MARTELPNGVILPAEYSDDWYEDMTSNLTKLDDVIGSDSEKLNSNDVAFLRMSSAALTDGGTGNFSDLNSSNKLKTGDYVLDSGRKLYQVVSVDSTNETFTVGNSLFKITAESDLAPVAESGDYDDLDNKPDLNPYDQHIADTDIHVTTADKNKWNNQTYVLRYSSASVTDNSTIAFSTLDNTDNIKSGDKVIDVDGNIFSIVSVDTVNQTVTVGSALIDLALDANVVHTSGNEIVGGNKTFDSDTYVYNSDTNATTPNLFLKNSKVSKGSTSETGAQLLKFVDKNNFSVGELESIVTSSGATELRIRSNTLDSNNQNVQTGVTLISIRNGAKRLCPTSDNDVFLGVTTLKWARVYSTEYYYGSNNVEFSTKFVTTDTNQTISGNKTFSSINGVEPSSLSLPSGNASDFIDISSYFSNTGSGDRNSYTASANGWIYLRLGNMGGCQADVFDANNNRMWGQSSTGSVEQMTIPILKGQTLTTQWNTSSTVYVDTAHFIPCQGNV